MDYRKRDSGGGVILFGCKAHQRYSQNPCSICFPGPLEVQVQYFGGAYDSNLGIVRYDKISEVSYKVHNPTKAEKAVDEAWERNR